MDPDPETATELARKGVTLLFLDVAQHTVLGVDTQVSSAGPRFRGMVLPGPHFVHCCSPSRHGNEFAPTVGFLEAGLVLVSSMVMVLASLMLLSSASMSSSGSKVGTDVVQAEKDQKMKLVEQLVLNLCDPTLREKSLTKLSKKMEMFPDLALLLWHSFGTIAALIQEILRIYPALSPPSLTASASIRVCNVLALFQCVASHPGTRTHFLNASIPIYLYPFLRTVDKARPFEYLRLTTLCVIGALVKDEGTEVTKFLLQSEVIPLCLNIMVTGGELSKTVSTFILLKILLNDVGLHYYCDTQQRCCDIALVLQKMVSSLVNQPSLRLLKYIIRCYLRLSNNPRGHAVLKASLPTVLKDGTFNDYLMEEPSTQQCLHQLLANLSDGDLYMVTAFRCCNDIAIMP